MKALFSSFALSEGEGVKAFLPTNDGRKEAVQNGWHVYEVKPSGKKELGMWDDVLVPFATIIRYVGTARGIAKNQKWKDKPVGFRSQGSFVHTLVKEKKKLTPRKKRIDLKHEVEV